MEINQIYISNSIQSFDTSDAFKIDFNVSIKCNTITQYNVQMYSICANICNFQISINETMHTHVAHNCDDKL